MKIEGRWLNASSPFNHPPASKRRFLSSTTSVCLLDEQPCQRAHWQGTYEAPLASRIVLFSPPHDTGPLGSEVIQSGPHPALSAWTGLWMSWSGPEKPFPHRETTDGGRWGELTSTTHPPAPLCNPFLSNILVSTAVQCFPFFFFLFLGILCPKQLCDVSLLFYLPPRCFPCNKQRRSRRSHILHSYGIRNQAFICQKLLDYQHEGLPTNINNKKLVWRWPVLRRGLAQKNLDTMCLCACSVKNLNVPNLYLYSSQSQSLSLNL